MPGSAEPSASARAFAAALVGCAVLVWSIGALAPRLPLAPLAAFALAYLAVTAEIVTLSVFAPRLPLSHTALACAIGLGSLVGLSSAPATAPYAALLTFALGGAATLLGASLGARIESPGQLAAVALVSAIADCWSVLDRGAPSARLAEQVLLHPEQLALFALPFPLLGSDLTPAVIGAGDVLFAALYVAAFRAHRLSIRRVVLALLLAFLVGLVGLLVTLRPLPLLPLLGLAVVLSEPAARSLTRREWRTVLLVCAGMIAAIALRMSR